MAKKSTIDTKIIEEGLKLSGLKSKNKLIELAIKEFVQNRKRKKILEIEGKVKWNGNLDDMRKSRF